MVYHFMSDDDVERIMRHPQVGDRVRQLGADARRRRAASARLRQQRARARRVRAQAPRHHARGSDPEDDVAARASTSSSTTRGLIKAGLLRRHHRSSIRATVGDAATFEKPHAYAAGVPYVLVNGVVVIRNGEHTGARPGQVLTMSESAK